MMSKCEQRDEDEGELKHLVIIIKGTRHFFMVFVVNHLVKEQCVLH